jgi:WD40 repeat protein
VEALSLVTSKTISRLRWEGGGEKGNSNNDKNVDDGAGAPSAAAIRRGRRIIGTAVAVVGPVEQAFGGGGGNTNNHNDQTLLWVGLESGMLCCYDLHDSGDEEASPLRRVLLVLDVKNKKGEREGDEADGAGENDGETEDAGGHDDDGIESKERAKRSRRVGKEAGKKKRTKSKVRESTSSSSSPPASSPSQDMRLHHLTLLSKGGRGGSGASYLVGYALVSKDENKEAAKEERRRPLRGGGGIEERGVAAAAATVGSSTLILVRFVVPPPSKEAVTGATTVAQCPVTVLDTIKVDKRDRVPFQLLSTTVGAQDSASAAVGRSSSSSPLLSSSPSKSQNAIVLVASPSALTVLCDGDDAAATAVAQANEQGRSSSQSYSVAIHHPKRRSNRLASVVISGGGGGQQQQATAAASPSVVATGYWNGEIRVWPTLLQDIAQYQTDLARFWEGAKASGNKKRFLEDVAKPVHPMASSKSIRLHWHAHPVSSLLIDPVNPGILYSGGEESVLCVWDYMRSTQVSDVLPRISAGSIVHLSAADGGRSAGGPTRIVVYTSDNALHCIVPHNLSTLWKKMSLAAEPWPAEQQSQPTRSPPCRPVVLGDPTTQSLLLMGLPRSASVCQEWNCVQHELDRSWPVAPYNRVSRRDWDGPEVPGPAVTCAGLAQSTLVTVDCVPTENPGIGRDGAATTLKFWSRTADTAASPSSTGADSGGKGRSRNARFELQCAMAFPHGSFADVAAIAVSPDGNSAVTVSNDEKAWRLWRKVENESPAETTTTAWICECRVEVPLGLSRYDVARDAVAFSPDSTVLAMAHGSIVSLWDVDNTALMGTLHHEASSSDATMATIGATGEPRPQQQPLVISTPAAVISLQFLSSVASDMMLSVSASCVSLQSPYSATSPYGVLLRGWLYRARSGSRITGAVEIPTSRGVGWRGGILRSGAGSGSGSASTTMIAVVSYCTYPDASTIDLLDAETGAIVFTRSGLSGSILALTPLPRRRQPMTTVTDSNSVGGGISVWESVPELVLAEQPTLLSSPNHPPPVEHQQLQNPYKDDPFELLVLNSRGQLLSFCEVEESSAAVPFPSSPPPQPSAVTDVDDKGSGAFKIAQLFENLGESGGKRNRHVAEVLDWNDLVRGAEAAKKKKKEVRRRRPVTSSYDGDDDFNANDDDTEANDDDDENDAAAAAEHALLRGAFLSNEAEDEEDDDVEGIDGGLPPRLGSAFVRSFLMRNLTS